MTTQPLRLTTEPNLSVETTGAQGSGTTEPSRAALRRTARIAALVRRAQRGSKTVAFTELWETHASILHAILISMVPPQEAEDLLQEVALRAWKAIGDLQNPDRFSPWLCTIARNVGRNALVSRSSSAETPIDDEIGDGLAVTCDAPHAAADADEILQHIRQLPHAYREPLTLRLVLDLSGPEIAERTGLTPGSVRVNLCRGLKLLRERLTQGVPK